MKNLRKIFLLVFFLCLITESYSSQMPVQKQQCQAITKKGTQCKRMAKAGSNFCFQSVYF